MPCINCFQCYTYTLRFGGKFKFFIRCTNFQFIYQKYWIKKFQSCKVDTILIFAGSTLWQFVAVEGIRMDVVGKKADFRSGARLRRSAAGGRGERRRGRSGKPGRESRRREESGSTTKSLNRFAPPSATEHGSSAAITVPPSVHLCLSLFPSLSVIRYATSCRDVFTGKPRVTTASRRRSTCFTRRLTIVLVSSREHAFCEKSFIRHLIARSRVYQVS